MEFIWKTLRSCKTKCSHNNIHDSEILQIYTQYLTRLVWFIQKSYKCFQKILSTVVTVGVCTSVYIDAVVSGQYRKFMHQSFEMLAPMGPRIAGT